MGEPSDQQVANLTASESEAGVDEATSENQAVANFMSARSPLGLLDLPSEVRLMIFRHVLVFPWGIFLTGWPRTSSPPVAILRTSRLIYTEAFEIFYKENEFNNLSGNWHYLMTTPLSLVMATIQNIRVEISMTSNQRRASVEKFLEHLNHFGNPSITRRTLTVLFHFGLASIRPLKWFVKALGRFTNFRTVEIRFSTYLSPDRLFEVADYVYYALQPVLGDEEPVDSEPYNMRFHPIAHRNRLGVLADDDWADSLDGIRLEWD